MSPIDKTGKAVLFDIQHMSLDDGPGIRTGIFFKGCSLQCKWCHNPESFSPTPQLWYNSDLCNGCELCSKVCKEAVHQFLPVNSGLQHKVHFDRCAGCGECEKYCCQEALSIVGKEYRIEELLKAVRSDIPYYSIAGEGGITFTGGEPLLQWEFIDLFLDHVEGIHTAVETCGMVPKEAFQRLLAKVDLFLFDVKLMDAGKHLEYCGAANHLILENLKFLHDSKADFIIRVPLIRNVNDDETNMKALAHVLSEYNSFKYAEFMPYHSLGESKRERFGMEKNPVFFDPITQEHVQEAIKKLVKHGIDKDKLKVSGNYPY